MPDPLSVLTPEELEALDFWQDHYDQDHDCVIFCKAVTRLATALAARDVEGRATAAAIEMAADNDSRPAAYSKQVEYYRDIITKHFKEPI